MKVIVIHFSDGPNFAVPVDVIAKARAGYYAELDASRGYGEYDEIYKKEYEFAINDESLIADWAANNMNWDDVKEDAWEIEQIEKDFDKLRNNEWLRDYNFANMEVQEKTAKLVSK